MPKENRVVQEVLTKPTLNILVLLVLCCHSLTFGLLPIQTNGAVQYAIVRITMHVFWAKQHMQGMFIVLNACYEMSASLSVCLLN